MKTDLVQRIVTCLPPPKAVVAFVGAGGKTTCVYHLAEVLIKLEKKVLVTTTTKMFHPQYENRDRWNLIMGEFHKSRTYLPNENGNIDIVAREIEPYQNKLIGFTADEIDETVNEGRYDYILVEADGAKQKPIKAPAGQEPVIPGGTTLVIGLIGLDSLGKPLTETYVHRSNLLAKISSQSPESLITEPTLVKLILSKNGLFKTAPKTCRKIVILNKADNKDLEKRGMKIKELLRQEKNSNLEPDKVLVGALMDDNR